MPEIDHIRLLPETPGWRIILSIIDDDGTPSLREFGVGDVIQFYEEVERTLGKWLADGPADFHGAEIDDMQPEVDGWPVDPDLARDIERGK